MGNMFVAASRSERDARPSGTSSFCECSGCGNPDTSCLYYDKPVMSCNLLRPVKCRLKYAIIFLLGTPSICWLSLRANGRWAQACVQIVSFGCQIDFSSCAVSARLPIFAPSGSVFRSNDEDSCMFGCDPSE